MSQFDFEGLPAVDDIKARINARYDQLFHVDDTGDCHCYVCCFCDEFLTHEKDVCWVNADKVAKNADLFRWASVLDMDDYSIDHVAAYKLEDRNGILSDSRWLKGLALSPRGLIGRKTNNLRSKPSFTSCNKCQFAILNPSPYTPLYAIVNRNYIGAAPDCLTELTNLERALLTPVKGYGYCFTYKGGKMMNLKGTMAFLRVEERTIGRAMMQLETMGLTKHVVILLTGNMTRNQRQKVEQSIRTDKLLAALEWLVENHLLWRHVDLDELREELQDFVPQLIDRSKEVSSENENVESQELFTCYYPEQAMNEKQGGFDDTESFKAYVDKMQRENFNIDVKLNLGTEFVTGNDGDQLVAACLLQFPFGIGGINETRLIKDGSLKTKHNVVEYLKHLSKLSQPVFQEPFFQLVMYSLFCKLRLLKYARLQVRGQMNAKTLAEGLNSADLTATIQQRQRGNRQGGTAASRKLLDAVDTASRALPHTDEAAKKARSVGEAMQHHFGIPSIFLTVTFDDENSFLMEVLCNDVIDDDTPLEEVTESKAAFRAARRRDLRLNFPGCSAINFEMLYHIMMEEVVGWDVRRNRYLKTGLFGDCHASMTSFEHQGRTTVHGHSSMWIRHFQKLQHNVQFGSESEVTMSRKILAKYHDRIATTALMQGPTRKMREAFDHVCTTVKADRQMPTVVDDQELRHLRHKHGFQQTNGLFAFCMHCDRKWTYEQLMAEYVIGMGVVRGIVGSSSANVSTSANADDVASRAVVPKSLMFSEIIAFQKKRGANVNETPVTCINATANAHLSCHVKSCFKCNKLGNTHKCGPKCECRYHLPDRARKRPLVRCDGQVKSWFEWTGKEKQKIFMDFLPKRTTYDLFQNVSCAAISESKFACNSNLSIITPGPIGQYQFKYILKKTQKDDGAEYEEIDKEMKKLSGRKHQDDMKEARRLIARAAFAHNKTNVICAPLASFILRNDSRFYFSHQFVFVPVRDVMRILHNKGVTACARYNKDGTCYFENQSLNYLCRPSDLEDVSLKTFFEQYEERPMTGKRKRDDDIEVFPFQAKTAWFQHPCAVNSRGRPCKPTRGVAERETPLLAQVVQWMFPDTAKFKGNILTSKRITPEMNQYAELVLTLFMPFRSGDDFKPSREGDARYPYVLRLREVIEEDDYRSRQGVDGVVFTREVITFLQNIQDCAYNNVRHPAPKDDLESTTNPLSCEGGDNDNLAQVDDEEEPDNNETPYELFLQQLDDEETHDDDPSYLGGLLQGFSFEALRNRGERKIGYKKTLPKAKELHEEHGMSFIARNTSSSTHQSSNSVHHNTGRRQHSLKAILRVNFRRITKRKRSDVFKYNPDVEVGDANGTVASIVAWAKGAKLDKFQRRAFEAMLAAFLLTFYDETTDDDALDGTIVSSEHQAFQNLRANLIRLKGGNGTQLVLLLHGPGGSGKSTVINLVVAYAREFCDLLGHPFTCRTIVISAMSGVAATLLQGETTHSAAGTNRTTLNNEAGQLMKEAWADARLFIIDECSFAEENDCRKIYKNTQELMGKAFLPFGGLNIVYAGDYSQMEPPMATPIYKTDRSPYFHGSLNAFIELDGMHRFRDDLEWGHRLLRFRKGEPNLEDIYVINENCLVSPDDRPSIETQVACYKNKNRDAVNAALFQDYCESTVPLSGGALQSAVLVFMDGLEMSNGDRTFTTVNSNKVKRHFYTSCGEDTCKMDRKRVDPTLKLYRNCPLMLTENKDVANGQANGSRVFLKTVNVKTGELPTTIQLECGARIEGYFASQINAITVEHEMHDILPRQFQVKPEKHKFTTKMELDDETVSTSMKGNQLPVISNNATTGHKLQGYTAIELYVAEWHYKHNWPYVILSRVRTMRGLKIAQPLSEDLDKYAMPQEMKDMLHDFSENLLLEPISDAAYLEMLHLEERLQTNMIELFGGEG